MESRITGTTMPVLEFLLKPQGSSGCEVLSRGPELAAEKDPPSVLQAGPEQ